MKYRKEHHSMVIPPVNSIPSWLEVGIIQLIFGIMASVLIIDVWNTSVAVELAILLAGFVINFVLLLWVIFYDGRHVVPLYKINPSLKNWVDEIYYWIYWSTDQGHFFINCVIYLFVIIFWGIWVGTQNGIVAYQPLPAIFTASDVTNFVIHKLFALIILGIAGLNWLFLWRTERWCHVKMIEDYKSGEPTSGTTKSFSSKKKNALANYY